MTVQSYPIVFFYKFALDWHESWKSGAHHVLMDTVSSVKSIALNALRGIYSRMLRLGGNNGVIDREQDLSTYIRIRRRTWYARLSVPLQTELNRDDPGFRPKLLLHKRRTLLRGRSS